MLKQNVAPTMVNGIWMFLREPLVPLVTLLTAGAVTGAWQDWPGGRGMFTLDGTFGGTTAKLQITFDAGVTTWDIDGASATAKFGDFYTLPACQMRTVLTGGAAISLNSYFRAAEA